MGLSSSIYLFAWIRRLVEFRQPGSPSVAGLERRDKPIRSGGILVSPLGGTGGAGGFDAGFTGADAAFGTAGFGTAGFGTAGFGF